ncbi:hypothetical protein NDU88_006179 [Pleurodeles waltl]|uniref:Uncharacterized protein n=1 Tax=Pleurodeles waltl TaxID=8319 RepID=A0AAV7X0G4_PLEWA|nr:hypothetical protein NDU88_006179 [Pleurodeles waltl]
MRPGARTSSRPHRTHSRCRAAPFPILTVGAMRTGCNKGGRNATGSLMPALHLSPWRGNCHPGKASGDFATRQDA